MTITQQLKEREPQTFTELIKEKSWNDFRRESGEMIIEVPADEFAEYMDNVLAKYRSLRTELIEHIEGELMDVVDGFVFVVNSELAKAMNKEVREQLQGYLRAMITNVLEDIKKGV